MMTRPAIPQEMLIRSTRGGKLTWGWGDVGLRVSQIGSATLVEPAILVGDTTLVEPITRIESATLVGHTPLIRHTIPVAVRLRIVDRRSHSLLLALMSSACCRSSPRG